MGYNEDIAIHFLLEVINIPYDIIGDIHGCYDELLELLEKLGYKNHNNTFVHPQGRQMGFVGDAADRGPRSLDVWKLLFNQQDADALVYSPGNHCNKFHRYLNGHNVQITHGLETTVAEYLEYPKEKRAMFRKRFFSFFERIPYYNKLDEGKLIISHAGIREDMIDKPIQKNIIVFVLFGDITGKQHPDGRPIRGDWAKSYRGDAFIVYGHTPIKEVRFMKKTANIDTGCVFGGKLSALRYPEMETISVPSKQPYIAEKFHDYLD
jgi:protein phosphatase